MYMNLETGEEFDDVEEYIESLKKDDSYHFTIPFEYIKKKLGNDEYDIGIMDMEVDVVWDYDMNRYQIKYYAPDENLLDPNEGNDDLESFYDCQIEDKLFDELCECGIDSIAIDIQAEKAN